MRKLDMGKRQASDSMNSSVFQSLAIGAKRLKKTWMPLVCLLSCSVWGQIGNYLGPGVLSRGAGDIGTRSGAQVDLRYYFDVSGVYDTGLQPFAVDPKATWSR